MSGRNAEAVVLVHGLWMPGYELGPLARWLRHDGFATHLFRYPTVRRGPKANSAALARFVDRIGARGARRVHLIGHSLGGLVILHMLADHPSASPGRVVLIGSPVAGSGVAARMRRWPLGIGKRMLGRAWYGALDGREVPWPAGREIAMIAGDRNVGLGRVIGPLDGPADGTVSVAETRAPGLDAHRTFALSHFGLIFSPRVARAACRFLRTGRLDAGRVGSPG